MKKIKAKRSTKAESIAEVCKMASTYFWVFLDDEVTFELYDTDYNVKEVISMITKDLSDSNIYKTASENTIKNIIKENYLMVVLYEDVRFNKPESGLSWDGAILNGAS